MRLNLKIKAERIESAIEIINNHPAAWSRSVVVRNALRCFPIYQPHISFFPDKNILSDQFLCVLRSLIVSYSVTKGPVNDVSRGAAKAATSAIKFIHSRTHDIAVCSAYYAASCSGRSHTKQDAVSMLKEIVNTKNYKLQNDLMKMARLDFDFMIDTGSTLKSPKNLMEMPLWWGNSKPDWLNYSLYNLKKLDVFNEFGFLQWFYWYESLLSDSGTKNNCDYFGQNITRLIASQPDEWWKRGAEAVNADIARWLAEKESIETGEKIKDNNTLVAEIAEISENPPKQRQAAYRFSWRDGKLTPLPPDPAKDKADAAVMLAELLRKTQEFHSRLAGRNYEPRIARSVELLLAALPEDLSTVNPSLLRSRGRSIESDAVSFATSEELPEDVKSHLTDLAGAIRDVIVCYPHMREKEAEARALDLVGVNIDATLADLNAVRAAAAATPEIIAPATVEVLDVMAEAPEEPAVFARRDAGRLWLADRLLVAGNYLAELARGAMIATYDKAVQGRVKAEVAWRDARPKLAAGYTETFEFIKTPNGFFSVANLLAALQQPIIGLAAVMGYPFLRLLIDRVLGHLKKVADEPKDPE
jgi:hypothetical protein